MKNNTKIHIFPPRTQMFIKIKGIKNTMKRESIFHRIYKEVSTNEFN